MFCRRTYPLSKLAASLTGKGMPNSPWGRQESVNPAQAVECPLKQVQQQMCSIHLVILALPQLDSAPSGKYVGAAECPLGSIQELNSSHSMA